MAVVGANRQSMYLRSLPSSDLHFHYNHTCNHNTLATRGRYRNTTREDRCKHRRNTRSSQPAPQKHKKPTGNTRAEAQGIIEQMQRANKRHRSQVSNTPDHRNQHQEAHTSSRPHRRNWQQEPVERTQAGAREHPHLPVFTSQQTNITLRQGPTCH